MARLFDAFVMVDWSASSTPKTGRDSIWIGVNKRDARFRPTFEAHNPATRTAALASLREIIGDLRRRGERVLVGFDFPLGYPRGTAAKLGLKDADWSGMWKFLADNVVDKPTNLNNRFAVANKANRLMTDSAKPFWGCPAKDAQTWLSSTKPEHTADLPPVLRAAEIATQGKGKAGAKSVWQIFGNGTVGSQAIVGIPAVRALKLELGEKAKAWPFETGWKALKDADVADIEVVMAEVYPALGDVRPEAGEIIDRAQVRALCEHFLRLDEAGKLGDAFGPSKAVDEAEIAIVEAEEGWILGA